jgi:predicted phosphohydrolase
MTRLAWATDTHLDRMNMKRFPREFGAKIAADTSAEVLLITGDIAEASTFSKALIGVSEGFGGPVYFVLGNHDVWGQSFVDAHHKAARLTRKYERLTWLTDAGVTLLSETTALVGFDGWYDAKWGPTNPPKTRMGDWSRIKDFQRTWNLMAMTFEARVDLIIHQCQERCGLIVQWIERDLRAALAVRPKVVVATHVPPYPQNAIEHIEGRSEEEDRSWLPWYTNKALGDMLLRVADEHPDREILVLCGHAHAEHNHEVLPNLRVRTGKATYGAPSLAGVLDL